MGAVWRRPLAYNVGMLSLALFLLRSAAAGSGCLTLTDVAVFDAPSAVLLPERQDVRVCGAHIASVQPHTGAPPPAGDAVLSGAGQTLLPGLIDVHTHVGGTTGPPWRLSLPDEAANLQGWLRCGVTTILEVGGKAETARLAAQTAADPRAGPRIQHAGIRLAPPRGHLETTMRMLARVSVGFLGPAVGARLARPMLHRVETEADIRAAIQENVALGARYTKVDVEPAPGDAAALSPELLAFLAEEAARAGAPAIAHVGGNADTAQALAAGIRIFAHGINTEPISDAVLTALREADAVVFSTVLLAVGMQEMAEGRWTPSALDQQHGEARLLAAAAGPHGAAWLDTDPAFVAWIEALSGGHAVANVRRMHAAGVTVLPGTDSVIPAALAGSALHRELGLLVERGDFTPAEALSAATYRAAVFLGLGGTTGRVAAGWEADLLLVAGDPTADIAQVSAIQAVFRQGVRVE